VAQAIQNIFHGLKTQIWKPLFAKLVSPTDSWEEIETVAPQPGEVRIRHEAIGVNFIDIYQRSGLSKVPLPAIAGNEGAGVVEAGT
jgi:NADPH:quinone reductase-like Zn-dependent oxidoreductase